MQSICYCLAARKEWINSACIDPNKHNVLL
jgi:hypothetical protein